MLDTAADALDAWNGAYPSDAGGLMLMILDISKTAAASAEQLWINGSIGKDERKQAAIDYVCAALTAMGIELTDAIRKLIDGAIEAACLRTSRTALELTRPCSL